MKPKSVVFFVASRNKNPRPKGRNGTPRKLRCAGGAPRRTQGSGCGICNHGFSFHGAL